MSRPRRTHILLAVATLAVCGCTDQRLPAEPGTALPMPAAFAAVAENGNAGDLVTGPAQDLTGQAVTQIVGVIGSTISDADCYRITITHPAGFSADVAAFGGNGDSRLFLFDRIGQAVWSNDDRGDGSYLSRITAAEFQHAGGEAGDHFLCVSAYGNNPQNEKGYEIFDGSTGAPEPYRFITAGVNSGSAIIDSWTNDGGDYGIAAYTMLLTGVEGGPHPAPGHRMELNAGDMTASPAQDLSDRLVTQIRGVVSNTNADADCYAITIAEPSAFSVEVLALPPNHDSQIFLFRADGSGVIANDDLDAVNDRFLSRIDGTAFTNAGGTAGVHVLCVSSYGYDPIGATGEPIFGNGGLPQNAGAVLAGWTWTAGQLDVNRSPYTIALTGVDRDDGPGEAPTVFDGFLPPLQNGDAVNVVKAGQTIPLRWRLTDAAGAPITTLGGVTVTVSGASCATSSTTGGEITAAAGKSGLQNLGDGYYQYNWSTPRSYAGSCKTLTLTLDGMGLERQAQFQFTR